MLRYLKILIDLIICCSIVFIIYLPSLDRSWLFFDENIIYDEALVPIPKSLNEIFEIISTFGFKADVSSSNYLSSSISINRSTLLVTTLYLILGFLFKKVALYYHLLNLILSI